MQFPTTRWDDLARASLNGDTQARGALEDLCRRYHGPVRQFILGRGHPPAESEDLAQEFFLTFLERSSWKRADRLRGMFRSFLLGALTHHLEDAHRFRNREKRGGGSIPLSLDAGLVEEQLPLPHVPPDDAARFDRAWALRVLEGALARVRRQYSEEGKAGAYQRLKAFLPGSDSPPSYQESADALGIPLAALKTQIHRLRQNFRTALRREVADTVSAPHEIEGELRYLQSVLLRIDGDSVAGGKPPGPDGK